MFNFAFMCRLFMSINKRCTKTYMEGRIVYIQYLTPEKNTRKLKGMFFISSLALMNFNEHIHSEFDRSMTYEIPSHACFQYIFTSAISLT